MCVGSCVLFLFADHKHVFFLFLFFFIAFFLFLFSSLFVLCCFLVPHRDSLFKPGLPIQCISAIDIALWDVLGKLNEPVYQLLGGKTKGKLPVYATTARPDLAYQLGFKGAKFPLPYGPADGKGKKILAYFAR